MKRSDGYWERRAAERMYEDMERAEGVADQIADVYQKTAVYLTGQAKKVFDKFRREHGLTEKQAKALLDKARSRKDLDKLLHELSTRAVTDEEKDAIYRILEAPAYAARISRLEDLLQQVDHVMGDAYKQEVSLNRDFYVQLAKDAYYHTIYDIQQRAGAAFSFAHVSRKQINNTLQMPWSGKNYSTRIWDNTQKLADILKTEMVVSLITGRTDRETTKVIQEAMGSGAMQSRRLVRTEAAHVSSDFTLRSYKECGIENYRYVAILDLKTSEVCRELDGQEFPVEEAKTGENYPPMHPWCRSTTIAAPTPEQLKTMKRRARDPVTGKQMLVPMAMTYKEWYAKYVEGKAILETKKDGVRNLTHDQFERYRERGVGPETYEEFLKAKADPEIWEQLKREFKDTKEYETYKEILGDDAPKTLEEFQRIKYNDPEKWDFIKLDYQRRQQLRSRPELSLPNSVNVIIDDRKFTKYLFSKDNPRGKSKGDAFTSRLGYSLENWKKLKDELIRNASLYPAKDKGLTVYGHKYEQKTIIYGLKGTPANVMVSWMVNSEGKTIMTSAYIKEVKKDEHRPV